MNKGFISPEALIDDSKLGLNLKIYKDVSVKQSNLEDFVSIGDQTTISGSSIGIHTAINRRNYLLKSRIGRYSYTGIGTMILSSEIGDFCSISWNVSIGGAEHENQHVSTLPYWRFQLMQKGFYKELSEKNESNCVIGNDVLISSNVTILRNVTIGNGAIIGAGAVVTRDVEPYSIVAGVPAKRMRMRFDEKTIKILQEIQWWNWPNHMIEKHSELLFNTTIDNLTLNKLFNIHQGIRDNI